MKKRTYPRNGYTLMEIIITVIILGVIVSLAVPNYTMSVEKTKAAEGAQMLEALLNAQRRYQIEYGVYANDLNNLDIEFTAGTNNFNMPTLSTNPSQLASIERRNGDYILSIDSQGSIVCNNADLCPKLGYKVP